MENKFVPKIPPPSLVSLIHELLLELLKHNPTATSSEAYVQNYIELELIKYNVAPPHSRYFLRTGINYHGNKVQHIAIDNNGKLIGWNEMGDALATGKNAKVLLAGVTIFDREPNEPNMSDTKIGGGEMLPDTYIRVEFKARGWLGKTKNLGGDQLEKDIDLLKMDKADLLIICLSETAHRKWRGEGPQHQAERRTGTARFLPIFVPVDTLVDIQILERDIVFEGQNWTVSSRRIIASSTSMMPGAEHFITMCWRRN